ncbi:MAG: MoxR family ATPase [Planctomycetes bacterium]|nr:MoxR family ATPase [Planctomycetota bacterium]
MTTPSEVASRVAALERNVSKVVLGKADAVRLVLTGLLAGGHVLLEDVPGVGKTVLAKALARSVDCDFRRVQFTPDLLPSDVLGVSVYDPSSGRFEFKPGPVFTHVLLADEINRATPRTQSALLEAMNERQVSVDRTTHPLPEPFLVVATQNPYEFEGTYPLPESQLDRFLVRVRMGYPAPDDERAILAAQRERHPLDDLQPVVTGADVRAMQAAVRAVRTEPPVVDYVLAVVRATRSHKHLALGASPRATLALSRAAQARALLEGRDFVLPDDVKALAVPVLAHRVLGTGVAADGSDERERVVAEILDAVEVPI